MRTKNNTVGTFEAKTHLSQLLDEVQNGNEVTITKRGRPIARLIPYKKNKKGESVKKILESFNAIRESVKGEVNIKSYIVEGRKY